MFGRGTNLCRCLKIAKNKLKRKSMFLRRIQLDEDETHLTSVRVLKKKYAL